MRCSVCGKKMESPSTGVYRCYNCGHAVSDCGYSAANCDIPAPKGFGKQEGWICPVCGRGVAPWVDVCPCQGFEMKITCGTTLCDGNTFSVGNGDATQFAVTRDDSEWYKYGTYTGSDEN